MRSQATIIQRLTVLLLLSLATAPQLGAQEALVLSGGGARGLAHVGVVLHLKVSGYDPDLVIGNSMGAVVGALYAAGYEPEDIRRRILSVQWGQMFAATPIVIGPDRAARSPALTFDLDVTRLRFSRGLLGQWRVNRALARLLFDANVRSGGDFDRLARRYRAVAADLTTGERVVLDRGDLARAVRASMAYPGFIAPVVWEGRVLVDGGVADNFPTSVARELDARRIVGVDVTRPTERIASQAPLSVIQRALNLMHVNLQRDTLPLDGLVLPRDDAPFTGLSFPDDPEPLIQIGLAAARRDLAGLRPTTNAGKRVLPPPPASFSTLILEAPDSALAALARRIFADAIGTPYDPDAVLAAIDRLFTTGLFEGVWPRVGFRADSGGSAPLVVRLDAPPAQSLAVGAHFENDRGGRAWLSLDRYDRLGRLPAVFSASLATGGLERWGALSARIHSLGWPSVAWSVGGHVLERDVRFFEEDGRRVLEVLRAGGWAGLEFPFLLRDRLLTAVVRAEWIDLEDGSDGAAAGPLFRFSGRPEARVVGTPLLVELERRWGSRSYARAVFSGARSADVNGVQLAAMIDLRAVSSEAPVDVHSALGDDHAIPGLRWGEERDRARVVAGADLAVPVRTAFFRLRLRTGSVATDPSALMDSAWITGGQIGLFLPTPFGVLDAGYGIAATGDGRFDLSLGRRF